MVFAVLRRAPEEPWQLPAGAGGSKETIYLQWSCLCWHDLLDAPHCCWCYQFCPLFCTVWSELSVLARTGGVHRGCKFQRTETKAMLKHILPPPGSSGHLQKSLSKCLPTSDIPDTWSGLIQMHRFSIIYWPSLTAPVNAQIPLQVEHSQMRW